MPVPAQATNSPPLWDDAYLTRVRRTASATRTTPRAASARPGDGDLDATTANLVAALRQYATHRPIFWRSGTPGRSFDEAWLLAWAAAERQGDADSARFLSRRRVEASAIPLVRYWLVASLASGADAPSLSASPIHRKETQHG